MPTVKKKVTDLAAGDVIQYWTGDWKTVKDVETVPNGKKILFTSGGSWSVGNGKKVAIKN